MATPSDSTHSHHAPSGAPGHDHAEHHDEHIHEQMHYVRIWALLVLLFIVSVTGPMVGIPLLTLITAFGIAVVKASMVVKYFMHLDVEKRFVHYFLATSLAFMFLFFAAVAPDVMKHEGTHWVNVAANARVAAGLAEGSGHGEEAHEGGAEHAPAPAPAGGH